MPPVFDLERQLRPKATQERAKLGPDSSPGQASSYVHADSADARHLDRWASFLLTEG